MRRTTPTTSEELLRVYLVMEVLRATGEREFPLQLAVTFLWVAAHDGCLQSDLQKAASLSPGAVSRNVSWLGPRHRSGKDGLKMVRREKCPDNPKAWRLFLSPYGKQVARLIEMQLTGSLKNISNDRYIPLPEGEAEEVETWAEASKFAWDVKLKRQAQAKNTITYFSHIANFAGASISLDQLSEGAFWMEFVAHLYDKGLKGSTINKVVSSGRQVLEITRKAGLHSVHFPDLDREPESEARQEYFTRDQLEDVAFTARCIFQEPNLADAILFAAYTGVRQGELFMLETADIDWQLEGIWVGGKPDKKTKSGKGRFVPLSPKLRSMVEQRCKDNPKGLLFAEDWLNPDQLYNRFKKVRDHCGLHGHVWHSFRHSFGTMMGEVTHNSQIAEVMGHADTSTTERYVKPSNDVIRAAVAAI